MMHVEDILSTIWDVQYCGGYLEYCEGVQYRGYHKYHEGYLEYCGDTRYHGECHDACGGYHEYHGGVQYHRGKSFVI